MGGPSMGRPFGAVVVLGHHRGPVGDGLLFGSEQFETTLLGIVGPARRPFEIGFSGYEVDALVST